MTATIEEYSGWGYFDYRQIREPFEDGYQSLAGGLGDQFDSQEGLFQPAGAGDGERPGMIIATGGRAVSLQRGRL